MLDINEIKKDLYKSKEMAKFSHYSLGKLFYTIKTLGKNFTFPIYTIEDIKENYSQDIGGGCSVSKTMITGIKLSADLGSTNFSAEIKGSDLNRWIERAINAKEFF